MTEVIFSKESKQIIALHGAFWQTHLFAEIFNKEIAKYDDLGHRRNLSSITFKDRLVINVNFPDYIPFIHGSGSLVETLVLQNDKVKKFLANTEAIWLAESHNGVAEHIHLLAMEAAKIYSSSVFVHERSQHTTWYFSSDFPYPLREPVVAFTVKLKQELLAHYVFFHNAVWTMVWDLLTLFRTGNPSQNDIKKNLDRDFLHETTNTSDLKSLFFLIEEYKSALPSPPSHDVPESMENGKSGVVYLLSNPSMPGLLKIGKTTRSIDERIKELGMATGVPTPFELVYRVHVSDCDAGERFAHAHLDQYRFQANREFFKVSTIVAIDALVAAGANDITLR